MFYEPGKTDHGLARDPFKSCVVPRPIGWISTVSADGVPNLAPYSNFTNLMYDPPFILVSISEKAGGKRKDTIENIEQTGEFVYNMVSYEMRKLMNDTAAPFPRGVDEFEAAGIEKAPSLIVKPPRVAASPIQFECLCHQAIRLPGRLGESAADIIIGKVVGIHIKDEFILPDGKVDIVGIRPLARLGYSDYTTVDSAFEMRPSTAAGDDGTLDISFEGKSAKR